jgi:hypothetical protein
VAVGAPGGPAGTALPVGIPAPPVHDTSEDLTLRAAMYGVLFQSYSDKVSDHLSCSFSLGFIIFGFDSHLQNVTTYCETNLKNHCSFS